MPATIQKLCQETASCWYAAGSPFRDETKNEKERNIHAFPRGGEVDYAYTYSVYRVVIAHSKEGHIAPVSQRPLIRQLSPESEKAKCSPGDEGFIEVQGKLLACDQGILRKNPSTMEKAHIR